MPHSVRQEFKLDLAGRTYTLRPTFIGLDKLEQHLGKSVFLYTQETSLSGIMTLRDLVMCVWCGIYGDMKDDTPALEEIGDYILEEGTNIVGPKILEFLMKAMLDETQAAAIQEALQKEKKRKAGRKSTTTRNKAGNKK